MGEWQPLSYICFYFNNLLPVYSLLSVQYM